MTKKLTRKQLQEFIRREFNDEFNQTAGEPQKGWGAAILDGANSRMTTHDTKGHGAAGAMLALAATGGVKQSAYEYAKSTFGSNHVATKALGAGDFSAGGAILPEPVSEEIIELLRDRSVVRQMNPRLVNLERGGRLAVPKVTGDVSVNYIGENNDIPESEPETGQVILDAKKLAALVPISNDLIRYSQQDGLDMVREVLVEAMAEKENRTLIRADGTNFTPRGIRYLADPDNVTSSNGTSSSNVEQDMVDLLEALEGNNAPMRRPYWLMSSRSKNHLVNLRDANGNLTFPEARMNPPMAYGYEIKVTNAIPNNLGGGSDSEVYLVDASELLLGQAMRMEVTVSTEGMYTSGGSNVSAFQRDQSLLRAITEHDLQIRHNVSAAVKTGVQWGT